MTEEEMKAKADAAAKADADAGEKLDKILSCVDSLTKRMDSLEDMEKAKKADAEGAQEKAKEDSDKEDEKADDEEAKDEKADTMEDGKAPGEAEEVAADKRKDAEDKEEKMADAHAGKIADLEAQIKAMSKKLPKQLTDAEFHEMTAAQAKADVVFQAFGDSAPRPLQGEDLAGYRRRLVTRLKEHSPTWAKTNVAAIFDENAFAAIETQVYADALGAASQPQDLELGSLREIKTTDRAGREISTFVGEPISWMANFTGHRRRLVGIKQA